MQEERRTEREEGVTLTFKEGEERVRKNLTYLKDVDNVGEKQGERERRNDSERMRWTKRMQREGGRKQERREDSCMERGEEGNKKNGESEGYRTKERPVGRERQLENV